MVICYMLVYLTAWLRKSANHEKLTVLVSLCGALYLVVFWMHRWNNSALQVHMMMSLGRCLMK